MRRIGETIVTVTILAMVASLAIADQIRRKVRGTRRKPPVEGLTDEEDHAVESQDTGRAESMILHVL